MEPETVLSFWFGECTPNDWFKKDVAFDELIKFRFGAVCATARMGGLVAWRMTPRGRLAEIIVLDQFSRNINRGSPEAFGGDLLATERTKEAISIGADRELNTNERYFMYMPYMHSESKDVHAEALRLFTELGDEGGLKYEKLHKDIIDRFGRYPHRNSILGRESTPEELEFLKTHSGF